MESAQGAQTNGKSSAAQWLDADSAVPPVQVPIIEVAYDNGMWFSLPPEVSSAVLYGQQSKYTWDKRSYKIDFDVMEQTNTANGRRRSVRIIWVDPSNVTPDWTGQLPGQKRKGRSQR